MSPLTTFPRGSRESGRPDFAALVVITVAFFAPYFRPAMFPVLDAASLFEQFHYFYSSVFFGQGLPFWYPYGFYGIQSDILRLWYLTPALYLAGALGCLFRVGDALLVFKAAVLLEHITLLTGMYLLSSALSFRRATRLLLCVSVVGG